MFPVGGGDEDEDGRLAQGDVEPADLRKLLLPLRQQQPEDLVKVQPLEFLEVPFIKIKKNIQRNYFICKSIIDWANLMKGNWSCKQNKDIP